MKRPLSNVQINDDVQNIDERTCYWIDLCLRQEEIELQSLVYQTLLKQSYIVESPLNARFLHQNLYPLKMSERDGSWTIAINNNTGVPKQLVDIVLNQNTTFKHFKYENLELLSMSIIWLFTCEPLPKCCIVNEHTIS
ncbi:hypothetical protein P5F75_17635, partial [Caldifermentibacillus hisashii]|uniref:hypothetical protein n=1 Tax=Caldifermentibacillus hisashii TaxID=996558 RepID=UPI002E1D1761|nr:hypothetical protein [Caldifermentibacillus hisashii]